MLEQEPNPPDAFDAHDYIDSVRDAYRHGNITYVGTRNEDQQLIAGLIADEVNQYLDLQTSAVLSMSGVEIKNPYEGTIVAEDMLDSEDRKSYSEMRDAFRQLTVAIAIATERAERDGKRDTHGNRITSLLGLSDESRVAFYDALFSDFQELNALRFGAAGSGVKQHRLIGAPDPDTNEYQTVEVDPDKQDLTRVVGSRRAKGYRENMMKDGRWLISAAGKVSPNEYIALRKEFPEVDKSEFDRVISSSRNAEAVLVGQEEDQ